MSRPIRIGLIAEGETELGKSVPYIKPEDGGKPIPRENEGALHTLSSIGGLAIKNFETWLLADMQTVAQILEVELNPIENLENSPETKRKFCNLFDCGFDLYLNSLYQLFYNW